MSIATAAQVYTCGTAGSLMHQYCKSHKHADPGIMLLTKYGTHAWTTLTEVVKLQQVYVFNSQHRLRFAVL